VFLILLKHLYVMQKITHLPLNVLYSHSVHVLSSISILPSILSLYLKLKLNNFSKFCFTGSLLLQETLWYCCSMLRARNENLILLSSRELSSELMMKMSALTGQQILSMWHLC